MSKEVNQPLYELHARVIEVSIHGIMLSLVGAGIQQDVRIQLPTHEIRKFGPLVGEKLLLTLALEPPPKE